MEELLRAMREMGITVDDLRRFEAQALARAIEDRLRRGDSDTIAQDLLDGNYCYLLFTDEEFLEQIAGRHDPRRLCREVLDSIVSSRRARFRVV
jgi:hypothetical protein